MTTEDMSKNKETLPIRAGKKVDFLEKVFRFLGFFIFQCTNMTGHKILTQEEHVIHHSQCRIIFCKL